jgi:CRISPR-associated endonuclease/helicase Cas3
MNVLLVSECTKRALAETRRILDQFAERRGERTWQTPITQAGLDTLRRLLRKTARKNTAVACHWIRGLDHSELLWIVGDASRFNAEGTAPTNTTTHDLLRREDENDWHSGEDIALLAQMAALLHDLGKASAAFQNRLRKPVFETNLYRHEWVSLRLFLAFVGADDDATWLQRLAAPTPADDACWLAPERLRRDGLDATAPPFASLPPLAAAMAWLMVTHHRLPTVPARDLNGVQAKWLGKPATDFRSPTQLAHLLDGVTAAWNEVERAATAHEIEPYWIFHHGLPVTQPRWRARAAKLAARLLTLRDQPGKGDWLHNPYVMHLARLGLMLADHHYSGLKPDAPERMQGDAPARLFANTHSDGSLKQPLDEHLLGVACDAGAIVHALPGFERHLPRLARHRGLRKRSDQPRFLWQNKAADAAESLRAQAARHGGFIVNMASTGCGKTLANARIMNALAQPQQGLRCTFALGLRTLTLQTGRSYRQDLHLGEDELAVHVGGSASRALFDFHLEQAQTHGSASVQSLLEEDSHVLYEGQYARHGLLDKVMGDERMRKLLSAPMLACTVDHLTPATEAQRAGRQIAPMLRLMSSDLVLDELDDFDLADLPALTRLVHWAGLLGARVLLSSATLPPALVQGMFLAYRAGRMQYQRHRGARMGEHQPPPPIACLWVDEFDTLSQPCAEPESFTDAHASFVARRAKALTQMAQASPTRRGQLLPLAISATQKEAIRREFAAQVRQAALRAHAAHAQPCPVSGKHISFGLVRMANIEPLFDVALELFRLGAPEDHRIHLCVYHSRFPLLLRSAIENRLDTALNRRDPEAVFALPEIRAATDKHPETNHLFVVLGSPVTEVGRDHDYDWAVVEPSSMRSLIQLAGRVQRHRNRRCESPNIFVFEFNLRHYEKSIKTGAPAFIKPGFESNSSNVKDDPHRLTTHRLSKLLRQDEYAAITARPRIQPRPQAQWTPKTSLVDLEHARMADAMLPRVEAELNAASAWQHPQAALTWALPQHQPFRNDSGASETAVAFLPDDDEERLVLHWIHAQRHGQSDIYVPNENLLERINLERQLGPRISRWGRDELLPLLIEQTQAQNLSLRRCAERFAVVSVPASDQGWRYHPALGFAKKRPNG